jgi:hypothetical protein
MYGCTTHVQAPVETYHAVHREVMKVVEEQGGGEGLLLHLAYATEEGFDSVDVWESRAQADVFNATVMPIALERAGVPIDRPHPRVDEFDPIGLVVPAAASGSAAGAPVSGP